MVLLWFNINLLFLLLINCDVSTEAKASFGKATKPTAKTSRSMVPE